MGASPFRKAKPEQSALKIGIYGLAGSGKTFTSLLCAEGLAAATKKRIAFVDTERGSDFYAQAIPAREIHPEAFDFDALYTRSLTETLDAVQQLDPDEHSVLVIDSITHIWDAAKNAYDGKVNEAGQIPFHAWSRIKKPYKELVSFLLSTKMHMFICGRQGNDFGEDTESGEIKSIGYKMKAEGETPYEPHLLLRMKAEKQKRGQAIITAFAEKDRTGVLAGKTIIEPTFDNMIKPLLPLLSGDIQAQIPTESEIAAKDAEALSEDDHERTKASQAILDEYLARLKLCKGKKELADLGKKITPALKKQMVTAHVSQLRKSFLEVQESIGK